MTTYNSFQSDRKFFALAQFPYGISKSGEFTRDQVALLEKHGYAYEAIHRGERAPANEEEKQFLSVCQGLAPASTPHEHVWLRFCVKTSEVSIPRGIPCNASIGNHQSDDYDELYAG